MRNAILFMGAIALLFCSACAEISTNARVEDRLVASNQERFVETTSERAIAVRYVGEDPFTGVLRVEVAREDTCLVETYDRVEKQRIEERRITNPLAVGTVAGVAVGSAACAGLQAATSGCLSATVTDEETGQERPLTTSENTAMVVSLASIALVSAGAVGFDLWRARDTTTVLGSEDVNASRASRPCGVHPVAGELVIFGAPWSEDGFLRRVMTNEDGVAELRLSELPLEQLPGGAPLVEIDALGERQTSAPLPPEWEQARVKRLDAEAFERAKESEALAPLLSYLERFPEGAHVREAHTRFLANSADSEEAGVMMRYLERFEGDISGAAAQTLRARAEAVAPQVFMRAYERTWRERKLPEIPHPALEAPVLEAAVSFHADQMSALAREDLQARDAHAEALARLLSERDPGDIPPLALALLTTHALVAEEVIHEERTRVGEAFGEAAMARAELLCRGNEAHPGCVRLATRRYERAVAMARTGLKTEPFDAAKVTRALTVAGEKARTEEQRAEVAELLSRKRDEEAVVLADAIDGSLGRDARLDAWTTAMAAAGTLEARVRIAERAVRDIASDLDEAVRAEDDLYVQRAVEALGVDTQPEVWKGTRAGKALGEVFAGAMVERARKIAAALRIEEIPEWRAALDMARRLSPEQDARFARVERELLGELRKKHAIKDLRWAEVLALYPPIEVEDAAQWYARVDAASRKNRSGRVVVRIERERAVGEDILARVYHPSSGESCYALVSPRSSKVRRALERGRPVVALAALDGAISYRRDGKKAPIARLHILAIR